MSRYVGIASAAFDGIALPLPLSVRLSRQCQTSPAGGDGDLFATSVQIARPALAVEVRIRDTAVAEGLSLGRHGVLSFTVTGAVLASVELSYEQIIPATATLRFVVQADDGLTDPVQAEELP